LGKVELYHPVDEDKAREYVDATYAPSTDQLDEDQQQKEKDQRVSDLLTSAAQNAAWRESRSADEQIRLSTQPFASSPDKDDPAFTGEEADSA
jgi:hypothetical protein